MRDALKATVIVMLVAGMGFVGVAKGAASRLVSPGTVVYHPSAQLIGPCSRLRYRPVLDNTKSTGHIKFQFTYRSFLTQRLVTIGRDVRLGLKGTTRFVHVLPGSLMTINATVHGHQQMLLQRKAAPSGNYPACYAPRGRFHQQSPSHGGVSLSARFNNFRSTAIVRFTFIYRSFATKKFVTIEHGVMPDREWSTKYVRALAGSLITIRGNGRVLLQKAAGT
jgi:hypothetical protein